MSLVLHDHPVSSNALKVRFLLAELGLDFERVEVSLTQPRAEHHLAINPLGGVPTLRDGDLVLAESHAILRYLAAREARDDLYPADLRERARVDEFLDRWHTRLRPAFFRHEAPALGWTPKGSLGSAPPDLDAAARAEAEIQGDLALFDRLVGDDATCVLGRFTIADCAVAPVLFRTTKTGLDLSALPKLVALRDALLARPAFAAAEPVA
jgi:glutathione S-transferase